MSLPEEVQNIIRKLQDSGFEGYAVGGCVRDLLLGKEPKESGLQWVAKEPVNVSDEVGEKLGKLFEEFDSNDDVEDYFTNAE